MSEFKNEAFRDALAGFKPSSPESPRQYKPESREQNIKPGKYEMTVSFKDRKGKDETVTERINISEEYADMAGLRRKTIGTINMLGLHNWGLTNGVMFEAVVTHGEDPSQVYKFPLEINASGYVIDK